MKLVWVCLRRGNGRVARGLIELVGNVKGAKVSLRHELGFCGAYDMIVGLMRWDEDAIGGIFAYRCSSNLLRGIYPSEVQVARTYKGRSRGTNL
jgi:hypothetical protein